MAVASVLGLLKAYPSSRYGLGVQGLKFFGLGCRGLG